ncbi:MAG TPA: YHYH protein [Planctomycetaceae bacterium]|nr:YHYH protein [Planctomycetaceae bacterium]
MRMMLTLSIALLSLVTPINAADVPSELQSIGGRWYLKAGNLPVYYYRDGDRYVDLFSYHTKDSNKDGIDNVRLSHDSQFLMIESQGFPNHPTAVFPNSGNPNTIRVQRFRFRLPLVPKKADQISTLPMGPIGTAINGVVFFNPFEAGGMNAVEGYSEVWLDSCCGHPQQDGVYHYHKYPSCVKSPFADDGKQHSPIIGFAWDGFPVYGPYEASGVMARDLKGDRALDVCNGHEDAERGYHYHVTPGRFPYIFGGYAGVVERSNLHGPGRLQVGAIRNNAEGQSRLEPVIATVRPGTASRGKTHTVQLVLAPEKARRGVPNQKPAWAQIGPFEATKIDREGNVVSVTITIPDDSTVGVLMDCHIEFEDPNERAGTLVFKKNDAFRVIE